MSKKNDEDMNGQDMSDGFVDGGCADAIGAIFGALLLAAWVMYQILA